MPLAGAFQSGSLTGVHEFPELVYEGFGAERRVWSLGERRVGGRVRALGERRVGRQHAQDFVPEVNETK